MREKMSDYRTEQEAKKEGLRLYEEGLCDDYVTLYHHGLYALYIITNALTDED